MPKLLDQLMQDHGDEIADKIARTLGVTREEANRVLSALHDSPEAQRIARLLDEGATFMAQISGSVSIDLTPDVITAMEQVQKGSNDTKKSRNLLKANDLRGDVPTIIEFP